MDGATQRFRGPLIIHWILMIGSHLHQNKKKKNSLIEDIKQCIHILLAGVNMDMDAVSLSSAQSSFLCPTFHTQSSFKMLT